jgi:hypothetical protein
MNAKRPRATAGAILRQFAAFGHENFLEPISAFRAFLPGARQQKRRQWGKQTD